VDFAIFACASWDILAMKLKSKHGIHNSMQYF
jgi:hypothetical protein